MNLAKSYRQVLISTTKTCNLRCPRCYLRGLPQEKKNYFMSAGQFFRVIERIKEQKITVDWMIFSGGEPTLWSHLVWAIDYAKKELGCRVRVITNAIDRQGSDYGDADVVAISNYGGLNRLDILRLRRQLGKKRVKVQCIVHLPWPFLKTTPNSLPADCGCTLLTFHGDKAYPCGSTGGQEIGGLSVEEDFYEIFKRGNPWVNELCKKCLANRKNRRLNMTNLTLEFGVWDSAVYGLWDFKFKALFLRRIYRYLKWWK